MPSSVDAAGDDLQRIRLRVDRDVRPFDGSIAERLMGRVREVTTSGDQTATAELEAEVGRIVDGFQRRLDRLNASLDGWRKEGYRLPLDGRALPQDLLDWEANSRRLSASGPATAWHGGA